MSEENNVLNTQLANVAATTLQGRHFELQRPFAIAPEGYQVKDLEKFNQFPSRITETTSVLDESSFVAYFNKFCNADSLIVFDNNNFRVVGVIDSNGLNQPAWGDHKVQYNCPKSKQWVEWINNNKQKMDQTTFAEFIERNLQDFVTPSGTEMLELATKFNVIRTVNFRSAKRLQSGEFEFQFSEENQSGSINVPEKFTIGIVPFKNGTAYSIEARLRYRLNSGSLSLWYELINEDDVLEAAFNDITETITKETGECILKIFAE
jgi:uncharacterized protein YfdQ (DUF2303 family)